MPDNAPNDPHYVPPLTPYAVARGLMGPAGIDRCIMPKQSHKSTFQLASEGVFT